MSNKSVVEVTKIVDFEAAHRLPGYNGDCAKLHGHSYRVEVTVRGSVPENPGKVMNFSPYDYMVLDFTLLKDMIKKSILDKYDHAYINDFLVCPTAEMMAVDIFNTLRPKLEALRTTIVSVKVWETKTSYAEYKGELINNV